MSGHRSRATMLYQGPPRATLRLPGNWDQVTPKHDRLLFPDD
jgi:hypothetical protein